MADQPNSIFDSNTPNPAAQTPAGSNPAGAPNTGNEYADLLSTIKNERGEQKYSSLADALVGLKNAQEFIPALKAEQLKKDAEIERLRAAAERVQALEETIAGLTSQRNDGGTNPPPAFDESKLADLVNQTLTRREQEALQKSNLASVVASLQQSFGADAEKKFYDKAAEMGMTMPEMNALAAKSPKLVLTALGVTQAAPTKPANATPTPGTVNPSAFTPQDNTFVGRNPNQALVGATTEDVRASSERAKKMVEELHAKGMSVHDLTDPKVYAKYFK